MNDDDNERVLCVEVSATIVPRTTDNELKNDATGALCSRGLTPFKHFVVVAVVYCSHILIAF